MGFATPCGTEAIVHSFRRLISSASTGLILKLDFKNAFNSVFRSKILEVARDHVPSLFPTILQAYGSLSHLLFGDEVVQSAEGLQQGDPLAPPLFCLAIHSLVQSFKSPCNSWYLDDGTFYGPGSVVEQDLVRLQAASSEIGLQLNPAKCELYVMGEKEEDLDAGIRIDSLLPGVKILRAADCMLLGAPLTDEALPSALVQKIDQIRILVDRLPKLEAHTALFLLKNSLSIPRLVYLLRCCPAWKILQMLDDFDQVMRNGLSAIANVIIDDQTWAQASLPVSKGGLGIRSARDLSIPAFLASIACTSDLVSSILGYINNTPDPDCEVALHQWHSITNCPQFPTSNRQRDWEAPILENISAFLLESATTQHDKARLLASSRKEAGAWLSALPCPSLGLTLDNSSLRIAVGLRLGSPLCHPHTCVCGEPVNNRGTHGLSCVKKGGTFSRHSALNEIIRQAFSKVNVPTILEPPGMFRTDGKRADGLTLAPWSHGKSLVWDATCSDTLCKSYVSLTSRTAGAAAAKAENKKRALYSQLPTQYTLCPFAVETLGSFGDDAMQLVRELGARLRQSSGDAREKTWLTQRISVAIQRGNAASILATMPPTAKNFDNIYHSL
jgi:hypothetical protein